MQFMRRLDPQTEVAVRTFLARVPPELKVEKAIVFGSRARGDNRPDSDRERRFSLGQVRRNGRET